MAGRGALERRQDGARQAAEAQLAALGFVKNGGARWRREEPIPRGLLVLDVELVGDPSRQLPKVYVDRGRLPRQVPHVERDGRICLPTSESVLLDASRPGSIITDAVDRAKKIIMDGVAGLSDEDLRREFTAYWADGASTVVWALAVPSVPQELYVAVIRGDDRKDDVLVAGDSLEAVRGWANKAGKRAVSCREAFFIPLGVGFDPPYFDEAPWTFEKFLGIVRQASPMGSDAFMEWLSEQESPRSLFFSFPAPDDGGIVLAGVTFPETNSSAKRQPGKASEDIAGRLGDSVVRIKVERADPEFLTLRTGSAPGLHGRTVTVVGCGAVGSQVASHLALLGVGRLRLIDDQPLALENIHRHALGMRYLRQNKAEALALELSRRFPNLRTESRAQGVEKVVLSEADFLLGADAIVFATGDENLELKLNEELVGGPPRVHTWLEPLGIGGHAVAVGVTPDSGCFECLYGPSEEAPFFNSAAFASGRQRKDFGKSMSGCAGTFVPFSALDAVRTATEAANLTAAVLEGREPRGVLVSWFGDPEPFTREGFALSLRARRFKPGERQRHDRIERANCGCCRAD